MSYNWGTTESDLQVWTVGARVFPFFGFVVYDVVPTIAKNVCIWGRHHRTKVVDPGVTMSYFYALRAQKYGIFYLGQLLYDGDAPKCTHFWHTVISLL